MWVQYLFWFSVICDLDVVAIGTKYMVADCGGGTVDITVHEIEAKEGKLKELYKATGGPYGSVGMYMCENRHNVGSFMDG